MGSSRAASPTEPEKQVFARLGTPPKRPNIVWFISDQERPTMHFPKGWEAANLPTLTRLKNSGLTFNRAYCASAMCSPSRSALFTGLYPAQTNVTQTLSELPCDQFDPSTSPPTPCCLYSEQEVELSPNFPTVASMLKTAGYRCFYRGKWHLNKPENPNQDSLIPYGFESWDPPDAGQDRNPDNAGGGPNQNDERYISDAVNFVKNYNDDAPFFLVVSLVNPHDVLSYPGTDQAPFSDFDYGLEWLEGDIPPPVNTEENLSDKTFEIEIPTSGGMETFTLPILPSNKPTAQLSFRASSAGLGPLNTRERRYNYINFYANLIKRVDSMYGLVMAALDERNFTDDTFVFRFSDHGEAGETHGGLRQKSFMMYEEALRVPMVVSNPRTYQGAFNTDALLSLVDMTPTVASLAGVPNRDQYVLKGVDMSPIITDPSSIPPQNELTFTYDDIRTGQCTAATVPPPNRMQSVFTSRFKYSRYYDGDGVEPDQFEMYDLLEDPFEMENVANDQHPRYDDYATARQFMEDLLAENVSTKLAPLPTETPQIVINTGGGEGLSISWNAEPGVNYQVQYSRDLLGWFNTGEVQIDANGGEITMNVSSLFVSEGESIFFRVRMV